MNKSFSVIIAAAASIVVLSSTAAKCGDYPFGDPPYRLDYVQEPQIESGCWKWNWQLYQWQDYCPVYVHPKAYIPSLLQNPKLSGIDDTKIVGDRIA